MPSNPLEPTLWVFFQYPATPSGMLVPVQAVDEPDAVLQFQKHFGTSKVSPSTLEFNGRQWPGYCVNGRHFVLRRIGSQQVMAEVMAELNLDFDALGGLH